MAPKWTTTPIYLHGAYVAMKKNISRTKTRGLGEVLDLHSAVSSVSHWELVTSGESAPPVQCTVKSVALVWPPPVFLTLLCPLAGDFR